MINIPHKKLTWDFVLVNLVKIQCFYNIKWSLYILFFSCVTQVNIFIIGIIISDLDEWQKVLVIANCFHQDKRLYKRIMTFHYNKSYSLITTFRQRMLAPLRKNIGEHFYDEKIKNIINLAYFVLFHTHGRFIIRKM